MDIFFLQQSGRKMLLAVLKKDRRTDSSYDMRIVRTMTSRGREVGKETDRGGE